MVKKLISVIGPTAIGKTKLSIALAGHFNAEIISADSRQFYKEMSIGTAVPSKEELKTATHHFIQHKSILDRYSVGEFERDALINLAEIYQNNDFAIMVGGSGLYVDAITKGLDEFPEVDANIRLQLNTDFDERGIAFLQKTLAKYDPTYYNSVDIENPHRLIRALEICIGTGQPYSSFLKKEKIQRPFQTISVGITAPREIIYERINKRVDTMMEEGLLAEVKSLVKYKYLNALNTVGYKELFNYIDGHWTLDFALAEIKKNTRRFAKRQLTWFRKNKNVIWVSYDEELSKVLQKLEEHITTGIS